MSSNKNQIIFLSAVFVLPVLLLGGYFLLVSTVFSTATPSANLKITISSKDHSLDSVFNAITSMQPPLSPSVNKHDDTRYEHKFMFYKHAYWFPENDSKYYGVSLIEWKAGMNHENEGDKEDLFFISVFSNDSACAYCSKLTESLNANAIAFVFDESDK